MTSKDEDPLPSETLTFEKPFVELFLWAVLLNRYRQFLWLPPAYVVRREGNSFTLLVCPHLGGGVSPAGGGGSGQSRQGGGVSQLGRVRSVQPGGWVRSVAGGGQVSSRGVGQVSSRGGGGSGQ